MKAALRTSLVCAVVAAMLSIVSSQYATVGTPATYFTRADRCITLSNPSDPSADPVTGINTGSSSQSDTVDTGGKYILVAERGKSGARLYEIEHITVMMWAKVTFPESRVEPLLIGNLYYSTTPGGVGIGGYGIFQEGNEIVFGIGRAESSDVEYVSALENNVLGSGPSGFNREDVLRYIIEEDEWFHVAGVYNSTSGKADLIVNGELVATRTFTSKLAVNYHYSNHFTIGKFWDDNEQDYINGQVDEARLYEDCLNVYEVRDAMFDTINDDFAPDSLMFYYPLNDGHPSQARDNSGKFRHGSLKNSPSYATSYAPMDQDWSWIAAEDVDKDLYSENEYAPEVGSSYFLRAASGDSMQFHLWVTDPNPSDAFVFDSAPDVGNGTALFNASDEFPYDFCGSYYGAQYPVRSGSPNHTFDCYFYFQPGADDSGYFDFCTRANNYPGNPIDDTPDGPVTSRSRCYEITVVPVAVLVDEMTDDIRELSPGGSTNRTVWVNTTTERHLVWRSSTRYPDFIILRIARHADEVYNETVAVPVILHRAKDFCNTAMYMPTSNRRCSYTMELPTYESAVEYYWGVQMAVGNESESARGAESEVASFLSAPFSPTNLSRECGEDGQPPCVNVTGNGIKMYWNIPDGQVERFTVYVSVTEECVYEDREFIWQGEGADAWSGNGVTDGRGEYWCYIPVAEINSPAIPEPYIPENMTMCSSNFSGTFFSFFGSNLTLNETRWNETLGGVIEGVYGQVVEGDENNYFCFNVSIVNDLAIVGGNTTGGGEWDTNNVTLNSTDVITALGLDPDVVDNVTLTCIPTYIVNITKPSRAYFDYFDGEKVCGNYTIQYFEGRNAPVTAYHIGGHPVRPRRIESLFTESHYGVHENTTHYYFRVSASSCKNTTATGECTSETGLLGAEGYLSNALEVETTPDFPTLPIVTDSSDDGLSITLSWTKPFGTLIAYDIYYVSLDGVDVFMTRTASAATSYTLTQEDGVQPNTEFNLKVAAVTNIGSGPTSSSYFYVTVPEAPNVTAVNDENNPATSIYIRWTSQTHDNATLTRNRVEAALDSSPIPFAFLASASALEYQIVNLQPGTKYTLRVLVQNLDKDGRPQSSLYSEPIISYTNRWPQWTAGTVSEGGVGVYENETHIEAYMGVPLHLLFEVTDEDDKNVLDVTYIESAGSIPNGASLYDCNETCEAGYRDYQLDREPVYVGKPTQEVWVRKVIDFLPTEEHVGKTYTFCFSAFDNYLATAGTRCVFVTVVTPLPLFVFDGSTYGDGLPISPFNNTVLLDYVNCGTTFSVSAIEGSQIVGSGHGDDGRPEPRHPLGGYYINVTTSVQPLYPSPGTDILGANVDNVERNAERIYGVNGIELNGLRGAEFTHAEYGTNQTRVFGWLPSVDQAGAAYEVCFHAEDLFFTVESVLCVVIAVPKCFQCADDGDTLSSIATTLGTTPTQLFVLNQQLPSDEITSEFIKNKNNLIRVGNSYKVEQGDTLYGIATKFGTTVDLIINANGDMRRADDVQEGKTLCILSLMNEHAISRFSACPAIRRPTYPDYEGYPSGGDKDADFPPVPTDTEQVVYDERGNPVKSDNPDFDKFTPPADSEWDWKQEWHGQQ